MSDLPPIADQELRAIEAYIADLRRGGSKEDPKPHKLLMLLAVLDLIDDGTIQSNCIPFNEELIQSFERNFRHYSSLKDWCQPGPPYFHLRTSGFWLHRIKDGRQEHYARLTTSGGGTKRILDNIDYAFFRDDAWRVITNPRAREALRAFITHSLDTEYAEWAKSLDMSSESERRLGTAFHESFGFSRRQVSQLLSAINTAPSSLDLTSAKQRIAFLRENTQLGRNQAKAMPGYAYGSGLLDSTYRLTDLARYILAEDTLLELRSTQWLIHYHLSAPYGPGPVFWYEFVRKRFRAGDEFTSNEIRTEIFESVKEYFAKELSPETIENTKVAFVSTYVNQAGLGPLSILTSPEQNRYLVQDPTPPSIWVFALALLDYWKARYGLERRTINLDDLYVEGGLGDVFMMGGGRVNSHLHRLQEEGIVQIYSVAPPYQVVLLQRDAQFLLDRLYAHDDYP